jgi:hypothetical protein
MTPIPADLETDPRFPCGKWVGFWTQEPMLRGKQRQEMILTFRQGAMDGEGRDRVGTFLSRGFYSTTNGKCRWTKKYVGKHDVYYQGYNEGKGIWGTWEISSSISPVAIKGGFHIWPEGASDAIDPSLAAEADLPADVGVPALVG